MLVNLEYKWLLDIFLSPGAPPQECAGLVSWYQDTVPTMPAIRSVWECRRIRRGEKILWKVLLVTGRVKL